MENISSLQLVLCEVIIQKDNVFAPIQTSLQPTDYQNKGVILVDDVLTTLQDLAKHHRQQFTIPFLAITGSNGKTTTKEFYRSFFISIILNNLQGFV